MDFDFADYMLTQGNRRGRENSGVACSPSQVAYRKLLAEALNMNRYRILAFNDKPPLVVDPYPTDLFSAPAHRSKPVKPTRHIAQVCYEKISS